MTLEIRILKFRLHFIVITMLKKTFLGLAMVSLMVFAASPVLAVEDFGLKATGDKAQYDTANTSIYSTISDIISLVLSMAGLVFLAIMFYAGLRWMTARGDDEKVTKAKDSIYAAIIGFILVTLSYAISAFVFSRLIG